MRRSKFTETQIVSILKEADASRSPRAWPILKPDVLLWKCLLAGELAVVDALMMAVWRRGKPVRQVPSGCESRIVTVMFGQC